MSRPVRTNCFISSCCGIGLAATLLCATTPVCAADADGSHRFTLTYAATVRNLSPDEAARIWLPLPPEDREQSAEIMAKSLPVRDALIGSDARYGNQILYFSAPADSKGEIHCSLTYLVTRRIAREEPIDPPGTQLDDFSLLPDALVPAGGKSLSLLKGKTLPADQMQLGRFLFDVVDDHMEYRKDKPGWGRGDSDWACESGFGNCTDFHSLFISLARGNHLPAKFQMGMSIPPARGSGAAGGVVSGYHCWAWFEPGGHGWVPVDISEANKHPSGRDYYFGHLDADRIAFTTGRDLVLDPKQDGPPLNFFIFPYVEVRGKPFAAENVITHCTYEDVGSAKATTHPMP